jgi:4Fe-4S ferredoxin
MVVQMPKHIASGLKYLAAVKLKEAGESHQAIADELGIDRSTVSHYLNGRNLSWNSIDVARTITELTPRDFLIMTNAVFDEPEQSRKIVHICR